jgi:Right handed beta helix region
MPRLSRRAVLLVGLPATAATTVAVGDPRIASAATGGPVAATDLGIYPSSDSRANGTANRDALVAALSNSSIQVQFAPGDYPLDNFGTAVRVTNFAGSLKMDTGARFVFTSDTGRGLVFNGGTGARFSGLATLFTNPASRQDSAECVLFLYTTDTYLENVSITGSAAAGLLFWQCVRPVVINAAIAGTLADGLHFANCQDGRADQVTTSDTGDDGVAFLNYETSNGVTIPNNTGGLATNISVTRSAARGISVVGQSGVTIRGATINTTTSHGLYCAYEANWSTRTPTGVVFEQIQVANGGTPGGPGCGLRVADTGTVRVTNVTVDTPGSHGVFVTGTTHPSDVVLSQVTARSTLGSGFNIQHSTCVLDRATAQNTNGIGLFASYCPLVSWSQLTLNNTARTHPLHRALDVEYNTTVYGGGAAIADTANPALGYIVGAYGASQSGGLGILTATIPYGSLVIQNTSGLSRY